MSTLLFLLPLLVTMARGGPYAAMAMGMKGTMTPYYASLSELNAYWESVFPNTPIPSAILDRFNAPSGNERKEMTGKERYWSVHSDHLTKRDAKILNNWAHRVATEKLLFPEEVFTPGSVVNLYINKAHNARPLRRDIADSIPMSTKNFTAIIAMFAPVSVSLARDMWSTLNSCENPREAAGEQKACTISIESMYEFAASTLGTRDLHASTSFDVPTEGISSPSRRYKMVAVRVAHGGKEANTVTCHSMSFPFAVFYCHAINPTRIYEVTMQIEEDDNVPASMLPKMVRALAVCHPNTSGFDPKMAYWKKHGVKPGDASVCHFLTRGDVLCMGTQQCNNRDMGNPRQPKGVAPCSFAMFMQEIKEDMAINCV